MDPRDDRVFHNLNLVPHAVRRKTDDVQLGLLDEADTDSIAMAFREAQPFYVAADYHPHQPGSPGRVIPIPGVPTVSQADRLSENKLF